MKEFLPSDNPRKFETISPDFHAWLSSLTVETGESYSSAYYRNKELGPGLVTTPYFTEDKNTNIRESDPVLAAKCNNSGLGPRAQEIHNLNPYPISFDENQNRNKPKTPELANYRQSLSTSTTSSWIASITLIPADMSPFSGLWMYRVQPGFHNR